jgi:hypothetical protein
VDQPAAKERHRQQRCAIVYRIVSNVLPTSAWLVNQGSGANKLLGRKLFFTNQKSTVTTC